MIPSEPISGFKNSGIWPGMITHAWIHSIILCYWVPVTGPYEKIYHIKFPVSVQFDSANFLIELAFLQEVYLHDVNKHQCCSIERIEHIMLCHRSWCPFERQGNSLPEWDDCDSNDHVGATATTTTTSTAATSKSNQLQVNLDVNNKNWYGGVMQR